MPARQHRSILPAPGSCRPLLPGCAAFSGRLSGLAPSLGSRWAVELWCTPPVLESSMRMPPGVPPGTAIEAFWDGHRIAGEQWGEGPPVYLVHGWGGQRAHLAVFVKPLVEAGYRVVAFDLPSHNESDSGALAPGRTTAIECADAITAMIETHGPAHAVVAHSLGANSTVLAATQGAQVGRLVFLAPMGEFPLYLDLFAARHGFGRRIRSGLQRRARKTHWHATARNEHDVDWSPSQLSAAASHPRPRRPRQSPCGQ